MENDVEKREEEVVLQSIEVQMKTGEKLLEGVQAILSIMAANSQDAQEPEYGGARFASFSQSELRRLGLLTREQLKQIEAQEELISTAEGNVRTWIEVTTACLEQRSPELARKFSGSGFGFGFGGRLALQSYTLRERLVNLETKIRERRRRLRSIYEQIKKVGLPVTAPETPPTEDEAGKVEIFYAYAREDEDLRDELEKHLRMLEREGVITNWHDRKISAGKEWDGEIDTHLNTARVILLLVSSDFMDSEYCWDVEVERAMERHEAGEARVIPVILRPVDWKSAPFGKLQALPTDAKPVTSWANQDEAFLDVARGIRAAVTELRAKDSNSNPNH